MHLEKLTGWKIVADLEVLVVEVKTVCLTQKNGPDTHFAL